MERAKAELKRGSAGRPRRPQATIPPPGYETGEEEQAAPEGSGYVTTGGRGYGRGISEFGYGNEPRPGFRRKPLARRALPEQGIAPLESPGDDLPIGSSPIAGEFRTVPRRGFQQSKVNYRGAIDRSRIIGPAFADPEKALGLAPFKVRQDVERRERDLLREQSKMALERSRLVRSVRGGALEAGGIAAAYGTAPQRGIGELQKHLAGALTATGPHGAAILAALTAAPVILKLGEKLIETLSQPGHPLYLGWQRAIETEVNGLLDIDEKYRRLIGVDRFIVTQQEQYQPLTGEVLHNSLQSRDEAIISSEIGLKERAVGVTYG